MLYDLTAVKANIRNRDGKRVFFLGKGDQLTVEARDHLLQQRIPILPARMAAIREYEIAGGGTVDHKPENMTHLHGNVLVPKTHPRIAFRGAMDTLEAALLFCGPEVGQILELARHLIRCDVMDEPVGQFSLYGLDADQLRKHSHFPQEYYGQPHFMPDFGDSPALLRLNWARCCARNAELAAVAAFPERTDLVQALNRISSMLYILMIQEKRKAVQP